MGSHCKIGHEVRLAEVYLFLSVVVSADGYRALPFPRLPSAPGCAAAGGIMRYSCRSIGDDSQFSNKVSKLSSAG